MISLKGPHTYLLKGLHMIFSILDLPWMSGNVFYCLMILVSFHNLLY